VRPVGARTASWDFSPHTLRITKEAGLLYDSSLMADVDCYELLLDGEPTGVIEFPVEWIRDDAVYFMMHRFQGLRPYTPPSDVFDVFRREFEAAYEEGGIFQLTCHPQPLAAVDHRGAHSPGQGEGRRLVRNPCRRGPLRARPRRLRPDP
jgi:peptidoglycan-N-acetylglucosamine deacetylase